MTGRIFGLWHNFYILYLINWYGSMYEEIDAETAIFKIRFYSARGGIIKCFLTGLCEECES